MRKLWQWFCGYVYVYLNGKQVNRFLNLCSRNGIRLWRISYDMEHMIRVHIGLKDFYRLKPYLKKTKTKLKIISRKGFPFWCHRHPHLKWMFVFVFFAICILCYSFNFIWNIEIRGNSKVSTNEMLQFLETQEIEVGKKKQTINCAEIEHLLRQEFNQLGWVTVYFDHTKLQIEVKESLYEEHDHTVKERNRRYDLVANKDAIIYSIVTRAGTALIENGQRIKQGETLVLGQYEVLDDAGEVKNVIHLQAEALIYGDVNYEFVYTLSEMEVLALKIAGTYSDDTLMFIANQKLSHFIGKLEENGVIILDKNVMIDKKEKNIMFTGKILAREQIGINIPVEEIREYELE